MSDVKFSRVLVALLALLGRIDEFIKLIPCVGLTKTPQIGGETTDQIMLTYGLKNIQNGCSLCILVASLFNKIY